MAVMMVVNICLIKSTIYYCKNKINRGKGASIIKALNYIKNENTILIDGDLEIDVEDIPNYINLFEKSTADVISGKMGKNNKNNFHINFREFLINGLFNFYFFQMLMMYYAV